MGVTISLDAFGVRTPSEAQLARPVVVERRAVSSAPLFARRADDFMADVLKASTEYSVIGNALDGTIDLWNQGARKAYGYERDEVIGRNASLLHVADDVATGMPAMILAAAMQTGKWEGVVERQRKNGERFTARILVTPRLDPAGTAIGVLMISKDISSEIALTELQKKNIELENANRAKDRFLASMSHELRTPLNAIIGFTGVLLMRLAGPLTEDQEGQLKTVRTSGLHLLSLINDLLDVAKIESGNVELVFEEVVCQDVVHEVAETLTGFAKSKGLAFDVSLPDEPVTVRTDRRALSQILINFVNNAIKFTEDGSVTIQLTPPVLGAGAGGARLSVIDTGPGLPPEDAAQLFQAFRQLDSGSTRQHEGTGLGLYVSKQLAGLLGCSIALESQVGMGCIFSLSFADSQSTVPAA